MAEAEAPKEEGQATTLASNVVAEGDVVLLSNERKSMMVKVVEGGKTQLMTTEVLHSTVIGKRYGRAEDSAICVTRATPEAFTRNCKHHTQIIYHPDISLILVLMDALPGKVFLECGTGSCSLSMSFARALRPGRLYTFEFNAERQAKALETFKEHGVADVVTSYHRDVGREGFLGGGLAEDTRADGVFLDMPKPEMALGSADSLLVPGGKLCSYSPAIEQIGQTAAWLRRHGYHDVRTFETSAVRWTVQKKVKTEGGPSLRQGPSPSFTGYILIATKPPVGEPPA